MLRQFQIAVNYNTDLYNSDEDNVISGRPFSANQYPTLYLGVVIRATGSPSLQMKSPQQKPHNETTNCAIWSRKPYKLN